MPVRDITLLKSWFRKGAYPLASQFADWMESYWHKEETIPVASVEKLPERLNAKFDAADAAAIADKADRAADGLAAHLRDYAEEVEVLHAGIEELENLKVDGLAVKRIAGPMTAEEYAALEPDASTLYIVTD